MLVANLRRFSLDPDSPWPRGLNRARKNPSVNGNLSFQGTGNFCCVVGLVVYEER